MRRVAPLLVLLGALGFLLAGSAGASTPEEQRAARTAVVVGTSIEAGVGQGPGESWPARLDERTDWNVVDHSKGGGAYLAPDENGRSLRTHVDEAIAMRPDLIILGGPVNDLVRIQDVSELRWAVFNAVAAANQAGIPVSLMGILPFDDGAAFPSGWWQNLEQRRVAYNDWMQAMYGWEHSFDPTWPLHQTTSWRADARWFQDGLHPNRFGSRIIAEGFPLYLLRAV